MLDIARNTVKALARGEYVPVVYGYDRPIMRDSLVAVLRGIKPSEDDRIAAAFGYGNSRKVAAYDAGIRYLAEAYNTVLTD